MSTSNTSISSNGERLYFWAIGDLHFRALPIWNAAHTERLAPMFEDLQELWQEEGKPAFCVSPGDVIETSASENYTTAIHALSEKLNGVPFYPGVGNHEYHSPEEKNFIEEAQRFSSMWQKPLRYSWTTNGVTCIMLDYPDPRTLGDPAYVYISPETLTFLDEALARYADTPAIVFLHCPLRNTVLDRDPQVSRDFSSTQNFFSPENSQAVREVLAQHKNAFLYFSGHTHSGWEAPQLVLTEQLGEHTVTFVNLMSPWYTGTNTGMKMSEDNTQGHYIADDPNVCVTFAVHVYENTVVIRAREHLTRRWLKEWEISLC